MRTQTDKSNRNAKEANEGKQNKTSDHAKTTMIRVYAAVWKGSRGKYLTTTLAGKSSIRSAPARNGGFKSVRGQRIKSITKKRPDQPKRHAWKNHRVVVSPGIMMIIMPGPVVLCPESGFIGIRMRTLWIALG
jgi:hypothetical protein